MFVHISFSFNLCYKPDDDCRVLLEELANYKYILAFDKNSYYYMYQPVFRIEVYSGISNTHIYELNVFHSNHYLLLQTTVNFMLIIR